LRQQDQQLQDLGVQVCVVTFEFGPLAAAYVAETQLEWPLLVDSERTLYKAYGMEHGTWWNLYGPASIRVYLKLMARGRRLRRPGSDTQQLGGDVLIDPQGVVRLHHIGAGPADRPTITALLEPVKK
jgi:alkyl hydroperoxide reductase subunit AhpC